MTEMDIKYGYRELRGCMPPNENPTKFRLFWRVLSELRVIFFAETWIKDFEIWAPCDSTMRIITGGSRVPINQFDRGSDSIHNIVKYGPTPFEFTIEIRDHRSFQYFSWDQLSNFKDETIVLNVETRPNPGRLDEDVQPEIWIGDNTSQHSDLYTDSQQLHNSGEKV